MRDGLREAVAAPAGLERSVHAAVAQIARATGFRTQHHRLDLGGLFRRCA